MQGTGGISLKMKCSLHWIMSSVCTLGEASRSELEGSGSFEDMELKDGELSRLQGQTYYFECIHVLLKLVHVFLIMSPKFKWNVTISLFTNYYQYEGVVLF